METTEMTNGQLLATLARIIQPELQWSESPNKQSAKGRDESGMLITKLHTNWPSIGPWIDKYKIGLHYQLETETEIGGWIAGVDFKPEDCAYEIEVVDSDLFRSVLLALYVKLCVGNDGS